MEVEEELKQKQKKNGSIRGIEVEVEEKRGIEVANRRKMEIEEELKQKQKKNGNIYRREIEVEEKWKQKRN